MRRRQCEPTSGCLGVDVVDGEDAVHRLLLEPLAGVALLGSRALGERGRIERPRFGERAVPAEPVAEVDAEQFERAEGVGEHALREGGGRVGGVVGRGASCAVPSSSTAPSVLPDALTLRRR